MPPRMLMPLARRLARTSFAAQAVRDQVDLKPFREPPSPRLIVGVTLIGLSMLMGWPTVGVLGVVAAYLRDPVVFFLGGPLTYGLSWAVWGLGMLLAGRDNVRYLKVFLGWALRRWLEKMLGPDAAGA
ncbi:MAG: hypothetical protein KQJ78_03350 [Deltaproteobacteria bacterium]|nr:hypothetical protein [Deltaproteobacteria bacterium]